MPASLSPHTSPQQRLGHPGDDAPPFAASRRTLETDVPRPPCRQSWRSHALWHGFDPLAALALSCAALAAPRRAARWWALTGSNRRPSRCKRDALPTELSAPVTGRGAAYRGLPRLQQGFACRAIVVARHAPSYFSSFHTSTPAAFGSPIAPCPARLWSVSSPSVSRCIHRFTIGESSSTTKPMPIVHHPMLL